VSKPFSALPKRFQEKIDISCENGCWRWMACTFNTGYGRAYWNGPDKLAHRVIYTILVGEIQNKLFCCHHCDHPHCVNPDHIFLGTQRENVHDMIQKGRGVSKLTLEKARQIANDPKPYLTIAKAYGVSLQAINSIKCGRSWKDIDISIVRNSSENRKASNKKKRILTREQVLAIRADLRSQRAIAQAFRVGRSTIRNILNRKTYKEF